MATTRFGYPLIFGFQNDLIRKALSCVLQEDCLFINLTESSNKLDFKGVIPKLIKIELNATSAKKLSVKIEYAVASGKLHRDNIGNNSFAVESSILVSHKSTNLKFGIDTKNAMIDIGGHTVKLSAKLAKELGLTALAEVDFKGINLDGWNISFTKIDTIFEGTNTFIGIEASFNNSSGRFPFRAGQAPEIDDTLFQNLPTAFLSGGWGYMFDKTLGPVILERIERANNRNPRILGLRLNVNSIPAPNNTDHAEVLGTGRFDTQVIGIIGFDIFAVVNFSISNNQLIANWRIDRVMAFGGNHLQRFLGGGGQGSGNLTTGLPASTGQSSSSFGSQTIRSVSTSTDVLMVHGFSDASYCNNAKIGLNPSSRLYVTKGSTSTVEVSAIKNGPRQASLCLEDIRFESSSNANTQGLSVSPNKKSIKPGQSTTLKVTYSGMGSRSGVNLVIPNNDDEKIIEIFAADKPGTIQMPSKANFVSRDQGQGGHAVSKEIYILHLGGGPIDLNLSLTTPRSYFRPAYALGKITLKPKGYYMIPITFYPRQKKADGSYESLPAGQTVTGALVATFPDGKEQKTHLVGIVKKESYGYIDKDLVRILFDKVLAKEIKKMFNIKSAYEIVRELFPNDPAPDPAPGPDDGPGPPPFPIGWIMFRSFEVPADVSMQFETPHGITYVSETAGQPSLVLANSTPELHEGWLSPTEERDEPGEFGMQRWQERYTSTTDLDGIAQSIAISNGFLLVAKENGLQAFQTIGNSQIVKYNEWPELNSISALCAYQNWLIGSNHEGMFMTALGAEDNEFSLGEVFPTAAGARAITVSLFQHVVAVFEDQLAVFSAEDLPLLEPIDILPDPSMGSQLINLGRWILSLGQGISVYEVTEGSIAMHSHLETGDVLSAIRLGDSLVVQTSNGEFLAIDLGNEVPMIAGRIMAEIPHHSMLHTSKIVATGDQGLRVGLAHSGNQLHLHWLGRYQVNEEALNRLTEYEWRLEEGLIS